MKVVSDTSPLCYLILIEQIGILPTLFERILIPSAVAGELGHPGATPALRSWIADPPSWLEIQASPQVMAPDLARLHPGEWEAISLAESLGADLLIVDERRARQVAKDRGLTVTGLLGVLDLAAEEGLVSLPEVIARLRTTSFRVDPRLLKLLLDRWQEGRADPGSQEG